MRPSSDIEFLRKLSLSRHPKITELDQKLIKLITHNPRITNKKLAGAMKISEATVANRIRRLERERIAKVVGVVNANIANGVMSFIAHIRVADRPVRDVAYDLARLDECRGCSIIEGAYDIAAGFFSRDARHLREIVETKIGHIDGIVEVEHNLIIDTIGRKMGWVKLVL